MKIGILTFHSQLNYGGVLQCWALQTALEKLGHDVVVIDRWLMPDNGYLEQGYNHYTIRQWIRFLLYDVFGRSGGLSHWLRHWRTKQFIKKMHLTPYHFYDWKEAPKNLGVDCIVVGSDQVWHGGKGTWLHSIPEPYLLKDAPNVPAIAYAASFGLRVLTEKTGYAVGFRRFVAISVREQEGVKLVESTGAKATHVVDPTLLLSKEGWNKLGKYAKHKKQVVCYCLVEDVLDKIPEVETWAKRTGRRVTIISERFTRLPYTRSPFRVVWRWLSVLKNRLSSPYVRVVTDYGPKEFYRAFAEADECITNSFHAVMFSYICNCNVRILRPVSEARKEMFARLEEYASTSIQGISIVDGLQEAMVSLDKDARVIFKQDVIMTHIKQSMDWLKDKLALVSTLK